MRWLTDGRGFVLLLVLFATCLVAPAPALGQADAAGPAPAVGDGFDEAAGPVRKYVLSGENGTFHLIGGNGTAHYWTKCGHHAPCCCRVPYLAQLRFFDRNKNFLYYKPIHGDPETKWFAIRRHPSFCGHYAIWRRTTHGLERLGYFQLQIPN
jgi:hypothetical protein